METRSNQVLVGGVVLAIIAAIALFLVWITGLSSAGVKSYDIFFKQSVDGLAKGTAVTFSGVPSGQVSEIALWKNDPQFVRVRIQVKEDTPVVQGTVATLSSVGFTGVSQVSLNGAQKGAPPIVEPGPAGVPVIPTRPGGFAALLNQAPELLQRVSTLTERLSELLNNDNQRSLTGLLANANRLSGSLADRGPEIAATLAETRIAMRQVGDAAQRFGGLAQSLDGQSGPLVRNLTNATASAQRSMQTLDATLREAQPGVRSFSRDTAPQAAALVRDLRTLSTSLSKVATRLDQGGATGLIGGQKLPDYNGKGGR